MGLPILKLKGEPSEQRVGGPAAASTKLDSLCSIDSLHQSLRGTVFLGGACAVSAVIATQLISWYIDGPQNNNVLWRSNAIRFLTGIGRRDKLDWGNLPLEMWGEIGKRMESQLDIHYFRYVCKGLRSFLPSPTRFPLRLPPPPSCDPEFRDMPYSIREVTIYGEVHRSGVYPYMQVDQGNIFPLTRFLAIVGDELKFDCRSGWGKVDLAERGVKLTQLTFFAKAYFPCMDLGPHKRGRERRCNGFPNKLVLISSSNAYGVNPNYARASDLSVVGYFGGDQGWMKGRLALLRLGGPPQNWVWDTNFCTQVFSNIATYKGQLCTLDRCGRVFLMDYNTLQLTQVCEPLFRSPPFLERKSLFEACGDLYLFELKGLNTNKDSIEVYKLSFRLRRWLKVEEKKAFSELFIITALFLLGDHQKDITITY